jgi:DNA-directed RNA polymerase sigma subunit (sigma70/sigma32)
VEIEAGSEMSANAEEITQVESDALAFESREARDLDQQLAGELGHDPPAGATSSAGYLRGLGDRPRLPLAVERRLIGAAQNGDRRAREELVEAFLALIAGVARMYRGSASITRVELLQEGVVEAQ